MGNRSLGPLQKGGRSLGPLQKAADAGKTATGSFLIPVPTLAGVGEAGKKTATGSFLIPVPTLAGVGEVGEKTATGSFLIPVPTLAGVGEVGEKKATGSFLIPVPTIAGVGDLTGIRTATGSFLIPVPTLAGIGEVGEKTATGSFLIPVPTLAGVGDVTGDRVATGSFLIPVPTLAGTGEISSPKTATGSFLIPVPTLAGVGEVGEKTATGSFLIPVPTLAGVGEAGAKTATGSFLIPIPTLAGVGEAGAKTATGSFLIPVPTLAGVGDLTGIRTATGSFLIPIPILTGVGALEVLVGVYEGVSNKVRKLFGTDVEDVLSIPVQYDNTGLSNPDTGLWIRLAVNHQSTDKRTVGGNQAYELLGELEATIKAPLSDGDFDDRTAAQTILATFEGQKVELVEYGSARVSPVDRSGRWYQMVVTIPFKLSFKRRVTLRRHTGVTLTPPQVGDSIRKWFGEKVTDLHSLPTQFDDAPFTQPDADRWVRFTILEGAAEPAGTRGNLMVHRHVGIAVSQVFAPINTGSGNSLLEADRIADAFRSVSIDGITFRTPSVETIGEGREGKWYQTNISAPFFYETVTTI